MKYIFKLGTIRANFVIKNEINMMTREEIAEILYYCKTKGVTYKDRLKELGIPPWKFYDYKAKYAAEETSGHAEG